MALPFETARTLILETVLVPLAEPVNLQALVGRVLADDFHAPCDLPRWDNSEMDGFAVRATDCRPGSRLRVVGQLPAGASATGLKVVPGTAVRIMTGAPVPAGCDAVVPIENTVSEGDTVTLTQGVEPGDYIRRQGSDMVAGEAVIAAGTVLRPAEINLLAACGCTRAGVFRRPKVAILSTGDELVPPGETPGPGQIVDSNAYSLLAAVTEIGAVAQLLGIARDNQEELRDKIGRGLDADVFITSAGVSAGDRDLVRDVLAELGVELRFWKVAMKPSGPTAFGLKGKTMVFSLPGNPVSSMVGFEQLVRPALLKMMGYSRIFRPRVDATMKTPLRNETGKTRFLRVRVTATAEGLVAESAGNQNTGILGTMVRANGFAVLAPECREVAVGGQQSVEIFGPWPSCLSAEFPSQAFKKS